MTAGDYDANRSDKNLHAAVSPFCRQVRAKLVTHGFAKRAVQERLRDLAVKFECCEWITDWTDAEPARVKEKRNILADMVIFCRDHPANKDTLVQERRPGLAVALAAAITARPESGDDKTLLKVPANSVARGVAQHAMLSAIIALDDSGKLDSNERSTLIRWAESLSDKDPSLETRLTDLKTRRR
jgi:hypothetical protein